LKLKKPGFRQNSHRETSHRRCKTPIEVPREEGMTFACGLPLQAARVPIRESSSSPGAGARASTAATEALCGTAGKCGEERALTFFARMLPAKRLMVAVGCSNDAIASVTLLTVR